jgi:hypothetical protein
LLTAPVTSDKCFQEADQLATFITTACPSVVQEFTVKLSCNAAQGLIQLQAQPEDDGSGVQEEDDDVHERACTATAEAFRNLGAGAMQEMGGTVDDISCIDQSLFDLGSVEQCVRTSLALNTAYQYYLSGRDDVGRDYDQCLAPTTQTTTATVTAFTEVPEDDLQCTEPAAADLPVFVQCNAFNTRWLNKMMEHCTGSDEAALMCGSDGRLNFNPNGAESCSDQVVHLNSMLKDLVPTLENDPDAVQLLECNLSGESAVVYFDNTEVDACNEHIDWLNRGILLAKAGEYTGCAGYTTVTTTGTSTAASTATSTQTFTAITTTTTASTKPHCFGKEDAEICSVVYTVDNCTDPVDPTLANLAIVSECPLMCGACTSSTTTTTTLGCNGVPDPQFCGIQVKASQCGTLMDGTEISVLCPLMCGSCIQTTIITTGVATTATTTITTSSTEVPPPSGECVDINGQQLITMESEQVDCYFSVAEPLLSVARSCMDVEAPPALQCQAVGRNIILLYSVNCASTALALTAGFNNLQVNLMFGCSADGYLTMATPCSTSTLQGAINVAQSQRIGAACTPPIPDTGARVNFYFVQSWQLERLANTEGSVWEPTELKRTLAKVLQLSISPGYGDLVVTEFVASTGQVVVEVPPAAARFRRGVGATGSSSNDVAEELRAVVTDQDEPFEFSFGGVELTTHYGIAAASATEQQEAVRGGAYVILVLVIVLLAALVGMLEYIKQVRMKAGSADLASAKTTAYLDMLSQDE